MENEVSVTQELIPVEKINVPKLFTDKQAVETLVAAIREKAQEHAPDLSTGVSRKKIASNASKVSKSKTFLDGLGKDLVSGLKAKAKVTDNLRKFIRDSLDDLRDEVRKPLTEYEEEEKARLEREAFEKQYQEDWDAAIAENDLLDRQREVERREAELQRQEVERKAKEESERKEKERKEREERIAKEAAEKARREAEEKARLEKEQAERREQEAREAAERAERERLAAIENATAEKQRAVEEAKEKARLDAERKETERIAKEKAEKEAAERKARHHAHRKRIQKEAFESLAANGIEEGCAQAVVDLLDTGAIEHCTINY